MTNDNEKYYYFVIENANQNYTHLNGQDAKKNQ